MISRTHSLALAVWLLAACSGSNAGVCAERVCADGAIDRDARGIDSAVPGLDANAPADDGSVTDARRDGGTSDCPAYQTRCNGACIPTNVDPRNCGGCGVRCTGTQVCSAGACASSCLPGLTACSNQCVDLANDNAHCGTCGQACPAGQGCVAGTCRTAIALNPAGARCTGSGAPIQLGGFTGGATRCSGAVAQTTFRWALCSCTDIQTSSTLQTDGFSSTEGPYRPGGLGGGVGANDELGGSAPATIYGALWTGGTRGIATSSVYDVRQDLHANGRLQSSSTFRVASDGYVNGDVAAPGASFGGVLHVPASATVAGGVTAASVARGPVSVAPPCDCAANQLIPVTQIVEYHRTHNDNASIGLNADAFAGGATPTRLDLPCGRYYLSEVQGSGAITIVAHGRTALFVGGDVSTSSPLAITLDPTAELDVFIAGTLRTSSSLVVGSPNYPALARLYIGSTAGFGISSQARLAANFYAPFGQVRASAPLEVYGGIFAGDFGSSSRVTIHYDRQVLRAGDVCETGPGPSGDAGTDGGGRPDAGGGGCSSCRDCGNQACIGGACGACRTNADCCAPLWCAAGRCIPVPG